MAEVHPCEDCETGACPCGAACEGCQFTSICQTCRGSGIAPGPAPVRHLPTVPTRHQLDRAERAGYGTVRKMPPCPGCTREHDSQSPFYRLDPDEVHRRVSDNRNLRERPRCKDCGVPFGSTRSRWYLIALTRGAVEIWHWTGQGFRRVPIDARSTG